ncbi:EpsG family protein [Aeromonas caviae]|uniref:EpsG family protein n=1 Tax=Aeromonas caviae TaxID=648 RepID=UPI000AD11F1B|nr:hypothetical protein MC65_010030 [Aeromonas caviae]
MYIVILVYLFICSFAHNKTLAAINIFITFCIMSGWYFPAYDWINYNDFYANINNVGFFNDTFEPGFTALMKVGSWFDLEYHSVYILCNVVIYYFVYRYCMTFKCPSFVFFFIFSLFGFVLFSEQIRQGVALSIILFATRRRAFLFYALMACTFHYSAIFSIGLSFVINSKNKHRDSFFFMFVGGFFVILFFILFGSSLPLFDFIKNKVSNHLSAALFTPSFMIGVILYITFAFLCLYKKNYYIIRKRWLYLCFAIIIFGIPFPVFSRLTYYCYPYIISDIERLYSRFVQRTILLSTIILILGVRIVISPIYFPLISDYHYYLPGLSQSPDYDSIKDGRCIILKNNGINNFC